LNSINPGQSLKLAKGFTGIVKAAFAAYGASNIAQVEAAI